MTRLQLQPSRTVNHSRLQIQAFTSWVSGLHWLHELPLLWWSRECHHNQNKTKTSLSFLQIYLLVIYHSYLYHHGKRNIFNNSLTQTHTHTYTYIKHMNMHLQYNVIHHGYNLSTIIITYQMKYKRQSKWIYPNTPLAVAVIPGLRDQGHRRKIVKQKEKAEKRLG